MSNAGPSSYSPPIQRSPPIALNKRTSSRNALRDNFQDARRPTSSPPTTPPRNRRRTKVREKGKQPLRAHASVDDWNSHRHSHGLSWSSTTRDSVVDNLLFSLDDRSRTDLDDDIPDPEFDKAKYMFPFAAPSSAKTARPHRPRGHTYTSSLSSEFDQHPNIDSPASYITSKGRRSNSSSTFGMHNSYRTQLRSSKSGPMGKISAESQQTASNGIHPTGWPVRKESREQASVDRRYSGMASANRPSRSRRSMSMDQMFAEPVIGGHSILNRGRPVPSVHSSYEADMAAAPEPMVANGPRKQQNPMATGPVYVNQSTPKSTLRKITTQTDLRSASMPEPSPVPQGVRDQASGFVRLNSMRGTPPIPGQDESRSHLAFQGTQFKANVPRERPGFFKRVFGGSSGQGYSAPDRANPLTYGDLAAPLTMRGTTARTNSSDTHSRSGTRQASKDHPTGMPQPPPLNKKPSFFRRRKKSASENEPLPPMPPVNNNLKVSRMDPNPSVSSLQKVMDPYLANGKAPPTSANPENQEDLSRPSTQESSTEDSDNLDIFHSGYTPPPDASLGKRDPLSRSLSPEPQRSVEFQRDATAKQKMKVKRKNEMLSPMDTSFFFDGSSRGDRSPTVSSAKVSPVTDVMANDKENQRPVSRASTGDRIIVSQGTSSGETRREERNFSVDSNMSSETPDDSFIRPSLQSERLESKKSDRLFLKPTPSEEIVGYNARELATVQEGSHDGSQPNSARSPVFQTATSGVFPAAVHSPLTPSTRFHSATSLPQLQVEGNEPRRSVEANGINADTNPENNSAEYRARARKIFDGDEEDVMKAEAASWLGERNALSTKTLEAYMQLFDFTGFNILTALRLLCGKLVLKGETQQFDRIITTLSARWCECNPNHGFKAQDVVHTICYSLILLNTDLHMADIGEKMSRNAYVKNTLPTIKRVVTDAAPNAFEETIKPSPSQSRPTLPWSDSSNSIPPVSPNDRTSFDHDRPPLSKRLSFRPNFDRHNSGSWTPDSAGGGGNALTALVNHPWNGSLRGWELEIEVALKSFYASIRTDPLPLHGAPILTEMASGERNLSVQNLGGLKRSNSVVSKAPSDNASYRSKPGFRGAMTMGFQNKYNRSKPKLYPASTYGSSRTSFDDGNSMWSPVQSSSMSKYSTSKTLTSASMQSLGQHFSPSAGDFKHSIGFANALSQAIIREENAFNQPDNESTSLSVPGGLLEDEALALEGAPWAKEGLVQHKHHLEASGKKAKERSWCDCFAVISKGKLTLFAFNTSRSMSMGRKAFTRPQTNGRAASAVGQRVGGGDWMENAEQLNVFVLRQTIASVLPPPGYSKTRANVWALSLPSGAVHLFQVGTPDIALEFMTTANYWSARLSKEPLSGGVSNIEYGWSDQVINPALIERSGTASPTPPRPSTQNQHRASHMHTNSNGGGGMPRPSLQSSIRTSLDTGPFGGRTGLPGDKVQLAEWQPPTQSMMASQLMEVDQLKALTAYVANVEAELAEHNELKHAIELAYSPRHTNYNRAMANWQRKSDHLLREIVKFQTYTDILNAAQKAKEGFYTKKAQVEARKSAGAQMEKEKVAAALQ
ncbi:hypothetical protein LTR37_014387 [Vermiconidia calcicola]|uniref:Uncharacterized protein n=1 Tax=Vermiconidia calcicola TaxID=1690605 RepID=A0ACC3MTT0_9PEZI|nr:hypothetical protein LTR37_014387 [Vermiconidia calcicola]